MHSHQRFECRRSRPSVTLLRLPQVLISFPLPIPYTRTLTGVVALIRSAVHVVLPVSVPQPGPLLLLLRLGLGVLLLSLSRSRLLRQSLVPQIQPPSSQPLQLGLDFIAFRRYRVCFLGLGPKVRNRKAVIEVRAEVTHESDGKEDVRGELVMHES